MERPNNHRDDNFLEEWTFIDPDKLHPTDLIHDTVNDRLIVGFFRGARAFEIDAPARLFSSHIDCWSMRDEIVQTVAESAQEHLNNLEWTHRTLADFLHYWNIEMTLRHGKIQFGTPAFGRRITGEFFHGLAWSGSSSMPQYSWRDVQVVEKFSLTHYQVEVEGVCYGCYVPDGVYFPDGGDGFAREIEGWKTITTIVQETKIKVPAMKGLIHCHDQRHVQGLLYEWIEPNKANPTLSQVNVDRVTRRRRERWYNQLRSSLIAMHEHGIVWWIGGRFQDATEHITISAGGDAYLRTIGIGSFEWTGQWCGAAPEFSWTARQEADSQALSRVHQFLRLAGPIPAPFDFLGLPSNIRNMIYEILFCQKGYTRWVYGTAFRQEDGPYPRTYQPISGSGLFGVSRHLRGESLSFLLSQNRIFFNVLWAREFLGVCFLESLPVCTFVQHIALQLHHSVAWSKAQVDAIAQIRSQFTSLKSMEVIVADTKENWRENTVWKEMKKFSGVRITVKVALGTNVLLQQEIESWVDERVV